MLSSGLNHVLHNTPPGHQCPITIDVEVDELISIGLPKTPPANTYPGEAPEYAPCAPENFTPGQIQQGQSIIAYNDCMCRFYPEETIAQGINCQSFTEIYWYHPDYLGNTEFITDAGGYPYQFFFYSAFGESLVQQNANTGSFATPYKFNAKELDLETGNCYYGARYYNPQTSIWFGVDPLAHEYQTMSPYCFTANNPILFVDPDGRKIDLSKLSKSQRERYDADISILKSNRLFRAYYSRLEKSETIYTLNSYGNLKGSLGSYNETQKSLSASGKQELAQELFHAYQSDLGVYSSEDRSVREAEGDLISASIIFSLNELGPSNGDWDQGITLYYVDKYEIFDESIFSESFDNDFNKAVDARISMFKQLEATGVNVPSSYTQNNSGAGALALKKVVREVSANQQNLAGPRLQNGDYYSN